jgi:uncharacterized SAM-binding protein YcdF (DUF218 family)
LLVSRSNYGVSGIHWAPEEVKTPRAARPRRFFAVAALFIVVVVASGAWALRHLGEWLELDERLERSKAIVVLGGGVPFRAIEAANLYRSGWASEVWLTAGLPDPRDVALARIGIHENAEHEASRAVLLKLGVPAAAIQVVPEPVDNTASELRAIFQYGRAGREPVILVTSRSHTRRVRVIWNRVTPGGRRAIVRYAKDDPFDADAWWRTTSDALIAFREAFGIVNAWAGFPIAPRER